MWYYFRIDRVEPIHIYTDDIDQLVCVLEERGYRVIGYAPVIYEGEVQ